MLYIIYYTNCLNFRNYERNKFLQDKTTSNNF